MQTWRNCKYAMEPRRAYFDGRRLTTITGGKLEGYKLTNDIAMIIAPGALV